MILVTKVGILPPSMSFAARLARKLAGVTRLAEPGFARPEFHVFAPDRLQASVERSLAELGVDRVDLLLLHEVGPGDIRPEMEQALDALVRAGKIGGYGLATGVEETVAIAQAHPHLAGIAQFPSSVWAPTVHHVEAAPVGIIGTHSILGTRFQALRARLHADTGMHRRWADALGIDPANGAALGRLFLAEALDANRDGVVLFSSGDPANIAANVALAATGPAAYREQIAALRRLTVGAGRDTPSAWAQDA